MAIDPHTSPQPPNGAGYETRDANPVEPIVKFGVGLGVTLIIVAFGMRLMFGYFAADADSRSGSFAFRECADSAAVAAVAGGSQWRFTITGRRSRRF